MNIKKRLGEGVTTHERHLERVAARIPGWEGRSIGYAPLVGGLLNQNWLVEVEGHPRRYFVKVPGEGSDNFIDRVTANQAARNAHAIGVGPEVVHFDPADGLEVSEFLEGYRTCTMSDFFNPAIRDTVLDIYRGLHASPALKLTKTMLDMIDEHIEQGRANGAHYPPEIFWLERRYDSAKNAFLASGLDLVACFNDPMPGNFLVKEDGDGRLLSLKMVDYEFASNNERTYELGALSAEMFYEEDVTMALVEHYFGSARRDMFARVIVNRALADFKWACWAVLTRRLSGWDFDYQKYGLWKYMRARDLMGDPRWESWLRMI
jgi:thiamine kinase-like enzyme